MIPLITSVACKTLDFTQFGEIGTCLVEQTMFGDVFLAGIIVFALFTILIVKNNFPLTLTLPVGSVTAFAMWLIAPMPFFMLLFILSLMLNGGLLIIGILGYANR